MLKLIQKVITAEDMLSFNDYTDWSDNILPQGAVGYEITIGSFANNQFVINDVINSPFVIETQKINESNIEVPLPLAIYSHAKPIKSLRIHQGNKYDSATVINILIATDEKNLDQWLDEVNVLSGDLDEIKAKVELMYGTAFGVEDYSLGDRLLFLEDQVNPELWSNTNNKLPMAKAIGNWGDMFEGEQIGDWPTWDVTSAIKQGLIYDDTYLTEEV